MAATVRSVTHQSGHEPALMQTAERPADGGMVRVGDKVAVHVGGRAGVDMVGDGGKGDRVDRLVALLEDLQQIALKLSKPAAHRCLQVLQIGNRNVTLRIWRGRDHCKRYI